MIDLSQPVWVCVVEDVLYQRIEGLPNYYGNCLKMDYLYDLDEQQDVREHNVEHLECGMFMLRRYVNEGQVRTRSD